MTDVSNLGSQYQLRERIPTQAGIPALNDSSVVLSKNAAAAFYPQSTQSQTIPSQSSGSPFIFRLTSSREMCDLRSARLNFTLTLTTTAGTVAPDDSAMSVINRIRVLCSGTVVDDVQNCNILAALKHAYSYSNSNTLDSLICGWKYNTQSFGQQSLTTPFSNPSADARGVLAVGVNNNRAANQLQVSIPLRLISPFFNQANWWPLRNSSIMLEIYPEIPETALVSVTGTAVTGLSYTISNTQIRMDMYSLDSSVVEMMDQIVGMGPGIVVPFESTQTLNASFNMGGQIALSFNRAVSDLLEVIFVSSPADRRTNVNAYSVSGWPCAGLDQTQITLGAYNYPQVPTDSDSERVYEVLQTFNGDPCLEQSGFVLPQTCLSAYANAYTAGAYTADADMVVQPIAYPFRRLNVQGLYSIGAGVPTSLDGGQFTIKFQTSTPAAAIPLFGYCFITFVRLITISSGRISVSA